MDYQMVKEKFIIKMEIYFMKVILKMEIKKVMEKYFMKMVNIIMDNSLIIKSLEKVNIIMIMDIMKVI